MITEAELVRKIEAMGGRIYLVGGWVRDKFIGRISHDKDYVVCGLTATDITSEFAAEQVGHAFPVFLIDVDGTSCEVSLARTEEKTALGYRGFKAQFYPSTTIEDDLYRRDTTMNSMALSLPDMKLIDPYNGVKDIKNKIIRATSWHFKEDPVRSLRAARMSAQLNFTIEDETLKLMTLTKEELMLEPSERIFSELRKGMEAPHPHKFFSSLYDAGLIAAIFKTPFTSENFKNALKALKYSSEISDRPHVRFAVFALSLFPSKECDQEIMDCIRIKIPTTWQKIIRFISIENSSIIEENSTYDVICMFERIKHISLDIDDISNTIRSLGRPVPEFLKNHLYWQQAISEARCGLRIPGFIPPAQRGEWLKRTIARKMEERMKK